VYGQHSELNYVVQTTLQACSMWKLASLLLGVECGSASSRVYIRPCTAQHVLFCLFALLLLWFAGYIMTEPCAPTCSLEDFQIFK